MKYVKIFAVAMASLSLAACSDKDDYNTTAGVTVEMSQSVLEVKENKGIFKIPVKITGDANGPVRVTVKIEGVGTNPAVPFEDRNGEWSGNYIVTSETINIPSDSKTAGIEINTVDDRIENDDRSFSVTIVSAEGATIGTPASTIVTLLDNDKIPYEKIQGIWNMTASNYFNGAEVSAQIALEGFEDGTFQYGKLLNLYGWVLEPEEAMDILFVHDELSGKTNIEINVPQKLGIYQNPYYIYAYTINGGYLSGGSLVGEVNEDYTEISFDPEDALIIYVITEDGSDALGSMGAIENIKFTR